VAGLCLCTAAADQTDSDALKQLLDQHRWFELRDAIAGRTVPPFYEGVVASAFNQVSDAERLLNQAVQAARTPLDGNDAREQLAGLYMRQSRLRNMLRVLDDMLAAGPDRTDVRNVRDGFEPFRRITDQTARAEGGAWFACEVTTTGITLPAHVNGKPVSWLFDSGFSQVSLSTAEAKALGISAHGAGMKAGDFSASTQTQTGVADRITIGDSELRNVPVMIFPDSHPLWSDQPAGRRGIIGLPVAVALGGIEWGKDGRCRLGADATGPALADPNLAFDGESPPVTRVPFENGTLYLTLDTGAQGGTQLWQQFVTSFPVAASRGSKSTTEVAQIGGRRQEEVLVIPDLRLRLGGFEALLPGARVLLNRSGAGAQHGNLGMDVFSQASHVAFDFRRMSIAFR
jgi:hypothetical protein